MEDSSQDKILIGDLLSQIYKDKLLILTTIFIFASSSIFIAINLDDIYKSEVLVSVHNTSETNSTSLGEYGNLAALAGISLPSSSSDKTFLAIETIRARYFFRFIVDKYNFLPQIMATDSYLQDSKRLIYKEKIYNSQEQKWVQEKGKPSYLEAHKFFLSNILEVNRNKETGFISISISHESPLFAKEFLSKIILEVNELSRKKDIDESQQALQYLNSELEKISSTEVRSSINALIETQLKNQMAASIDEEYLLKVIDPSFVPDEKYKPFRAMICIFGTLLGFFLSLGFSLFRILFKFNSSRKGD